MGARQQVDLHHCAELLADPARRAALDRLQFGVGAAADLVAQPGQSQLQPRPRPLGDRRPGGPQGGRRIG
jgi:hypothetical protein